MSMHVAVVRGAVHHGTIRTELETLKIVRDHGSIKVRSRSIVEGLAAIEIIYDKGNL